MNGLYMHKNVPLYLILPSLLLALFVISYPLYELINLSLSDVNRFGKIRGYIGLENFKYILEDPLFIEASIRTVVWTVAVVGGTILFSVPIAIILNTDFHGRGIARTILMLPWAISLPMTAIVWRWSLNGEFGMLNATLMNLGLVDTPIVWLAQSATAFPVQIGLGILVSIPFTITIFLGGLSSIPQDLYEAAKMDGANFYQQFKRITYPLLRPFINMAIVLNVIYVFNSFPIIWVLTQGGPNNETDILVTYLYKQAFNFGHIGEASAVSIVMFAVLLVFTLFYARMVMKNEQ
ncbi:MAG: multiple sugar transport system permease protein [Oceanospirillaceae bacterium]|jgi:multiple sugar transport system permease protein